MRRTLKLFIHLASLPLPEYFIAFYFTPLLPLQQPFNLRREVPVWAACWCLSCKRNWPAIKGTCLNLEPLTFSTHCIPQYVILSQAFLHASAAICSYNISKYYSTEKAFFFFYVWGYSWSWLCVWFENRIVWFFRNIFQGCHSIRFSLQDYCVQNNPHFCTFLVNKLRVWR